MACLFTLLAPAALVAGAEPDPQQRKELLDQEIAKLKDQLEGSSAAAVAAAVALKEAETLLPEAQLSLAETQGEFAAAQAADTQADADLQAAESEVQAATVALEAVTARIAKSRGLVAQFARHAYKNGGSAGNVELFLSLAHEAESPADFAARIQILQSVLRSQNAVLDALANDQANLKDSRVVLETKRRNVDAGRAAAARALSEVRIRERQAHDAKARVDALVKQRAGALASANAQRDAELALLARKDAEAKQLSQRIAALEAQARSQSTIPTAVPSSLIWPADGSKTMGVGPRTNPVYGYRSCHTGIDIGAATGAPIRATADGIVLERVFSEFNGNLTVLGHGGGMTTWYAHQSRFRVSVGQRVGQGQVIGYAGATGYATGPHLHWEVRLDNVPWDPMGWFSGQMRNVLDLCAGWATPYLG